MSLAVPLAFDSSPHGQCYLREPGLVGSHVVSGALIGGACASIVVTLVDLIREARHASPASARASRHSSDPGSSPRHAVGRRG